MSAHALFQNLIIASIHSLKSINHVVMTILTQHKRFFPHTAIHLFGKLLQIESKLINKNLLQTLGKRKKVQTLICIAQPKAADNFHDLGLRF